MADFPQKRTKPSLIHIKRFVGVVYYKGASGIEFFLKKGEKGKLMEGLYEFHYLDSLGLDSLGLDSRNCPTMLFEKHLSLSILNASNLPHQKQKFTRYSVELFPYLIEVKEKNEGCGIWKKEKELLHLPFSSGHRRIVSHLMQVIIDNLHLQN